jgi:hypothetical protein
MAIVEQLPGNLAIAFRRGDEFAATIDFSIATTGYTWEAEVYSVVTGDVVQSPTVTVISAANGQISLSWTETQTAALAPATYGYRVMWTASGSVRRTVLDGMLEVYA